MNLTRQIERIKDEILEINAAIGILNDAGASGRLPIRILEEARRKLKAKL